MKLFGSVNLFRLFGWSVMIAFIAPSNPTYAQNWNVKKVDPLSIEESLEPRRVPAAFPLYERRVEQKCVDRDNEWTNRFTAAWSEDFYWALETSGKRVRIHEGSRVNRNTFVINVKAARKQGRNKSSWIKYTIRGKSLTDALLSGEIKGRYQSSGSYWMECTLSIPKIIEQDKVLAGSKGSGDLTALKKQKRILEHLDRYQKTGISNASIFGMRIPYYYDFLGRIDWIDRQIATLEAVKETEVARLETSPQVAPKKTERNPFLRAQPEEVLASLSDNDLCRVVATSIVTTQHLLEIKRRGLQCGGSSTNKSSPWIGRNSIEEANKASPDGGTGSKPKVSVAEAETTDSAINNSEIAKLEAKRLKAEEELAQLKRELEAKKNAEIAQIQKIEEEKRLAQNALKRAKEIEAQRLAQLEADSATPSIVVTSVSSVGAVGMIEGVIQDDGRIDLVLVDGQQIEVETDGYFKYETYVPRSGKSVEIIALDESGKQAIETINLDRAEVSVTSAPRFLPLNPATRPAKANPNAVALIIGISEYERTPAPAAFADKDAQYFYDYAALKLGVPEDNILELVNERADRVEMKLAVKNWLQTIASNNDSDIYVFFAGHGMASDDGNDMYLLPYDGAPALLEDSAIRRDQLFSDISQMKPNSVTVFLDTCYSGASRTDDMLIAARPVLIRAKEQSIPDGFTLITAATGEQTAKPLQEVEQGLFSYFLMQGMEGEADANNDSKITAGELHRFTQAKVARYSAGSQTPQLQGDADRVLVTFQ